MNNSWGSPIDNSDDKSKLIIVVRRDLKMNKGKAVAQGAHAAVGAVIQAIFGERLNEDKFVERLHDFEINVAPVTNKATKDWLAGEFTKITVAVDSLEALEEIEKKAHDTGLNVCKITDNGHTCFDGVPTVTCLAIGPCYSSEVDPITKDLKLF